MLPIITATFLIAANTLSNHRYQEKQVCICRQYMIFIARGGAEWKPAAASRHFSRKDELTATPVTPVPTRLSTRACV